jgi:mRNA interferase RelE/StbE
LAKLEWTQNALIDLKRLDNLVIRRIVKKISWFADNFENITPESLSNEIKGLLKFRVGDWRVLYTLEDDTIVIQFVGHRSKIYKRIK